jgi:methionyl-tRNA formyltransferase
VFSYHHGDLREYRGRPAGFWEFLENANTIGVTLQQLTDTLDDGRIIRIKKFQICTDDAYQDILRNIYRGSVDMLSEAVNLILDDEFSPVESSVQGDLYAAPGWKASLQYGWKNTRQRLVNKF